jgi:hypothetical protein
MRVLLESWYVPAQTGQPSVNLFKLAVLLIGVAITTAFWVSALMLALHAGGIHASTSFIVGFGLMIAASSGAGIAVIMTGH